MFRVLFPLLPSKDEPTLQGNSEDTVENKGKARLQLHIESLNHAQDLGLRV